MRILLLWLTAVTALVATPVAARVPVLHTILFVGNSFTFGAGTPVQTYRPDSVTDLNGEHNGGVPALFKRFAEQMKLDYRVSLETSPGRGFDWHIANRLPQIDRVWDVVVLQDYSTLNRDRPGDIEMHVANARYLAQIFTRRNPRVDVQLIATWARADLIYRPGSPWSGKSPAAMAADLQTAADRARAASREIDGVVPVGSAWTRAIAEGIADPNPYDGLTPGQIDLWGADQYHASVAGYYLEALMIFGRVTRIDPRRLGDKEEAARDLGLDPITATALQRVAARQLRQR